MFSIKNNPIKKKKDICLKDKINGWKFHFLLTHFLLCTYSKICKKPSKTAK